MSADYGLFYKFVRSVLRLSSKPPTIHDYSGHVDGPVVYVSHHQNMYGPVTILKWYPEFVHTWIFSVFTDYQTCYRHYVDFTFTKRFGWDNGIAKVMAVPAAWFASNLTQSAKGIPVYRQSREVLETMNASVEALRKGNSLLIFPDIDYSDNSAEIKEIYDGFLYVEKYYYRETKQHIPFVPIVAVKGTNEIRVGEPIYFTGEANFFTEKKGVARAIQQGLNLLSEDEALQQLL